MKDVNGDRIEAFRQDGDPSIYLAVDDFTKSVQGAEAELTPELARRLAKKLKRAAKEAERR